MREASREIRENTDWCSGYFMTLYRTLKIFSATELIGAEQITEKKIKNVAEDLRRAETASLKKKGRKT
jgi:hypothetical protein